MVVLESARVRELHTAGADSRQWRHVLNDRDITRRFRVIAFDLPYHGRSNPPDRYWLERYRLTTKRYVEIVRAALSREAPLTYEGEHFTLPLPDGLGQFDVVPAVADDHVTARVGEDLVGVVVEPAEHRGHGRDQLDGVRLEAGDDAKKRRFPASGNPGNHYHFSEGEGDRNIFQVITCCAF